MRLEGRTVIVTGGARNIGAVLATCLAEEGAKLVVGDIRDTSDTVAKCKAGGGEAIGVTVDVTDKASVRGMVSAALEAFGQVDVLVNNAGLYGDLEPQPLEELSVELWERTMAINLRGPFLCAQAVVPSMRERRGGSIINVSSGTVFNGFGTANYVASKAGVVGLTRVLAREIGRFGGRANAITPGFTMSQASKDLIERHSMHQFLEAMIASTPLGRAEEPRDLVGAVKFLASEDSSFVTGQILNVDGGVHLH